MAVHLFMSAVFRPRTDALGGDMDNTFILRSVISKVLRAAARVCTAWGVGNAFGKNVKHPTY